MNSYMSRTIMLMALLCLSLVTFGCGGGGGSGSSSTTTVSGTVLAGPATGAVVSVKANGVEVAKSTASAADGSYTVAIPTSELAKDLVFEASGGTFPDEATSTPNVTMGKFSAYVPGGTLTAGANVTIDPSSTIVQMLVAGGQTKTAADAAFNNAFGYTPDCSERPAFATMSSASTTKQRLVGLRAAAFSQLTKDLGMTPAKQSELIQALADDLSDGTLDGMKGATPVTTASGTAIPADIANCFAKALMTFQTSSLNESNLTPDRIGAPPFVKKALTASYIVEYVPGATAAAMGKTTFKIKLTNRSDNSAAIGKTLTVKPFMYMATKSHTTPMEDTPLDNGDGTYSCTVYYVMASAVNGMSMGVWELKVTIGNESAIFYPMVGMPMGNDMLTKLSGVNDAIMGMAGLEKRTWFLFNDGLTPVGGSYTFNIFLATKENGMTLTFPAVAVGSTLKNQANVAWTVNSISVEVSTDKLTWVTATDLGNGHWSAAGLTGLTAGTPGKIYVRLTVGDGVTTEQKTTDGAAVGATNAYQTFNVTPL